METLNARNCINNEITVSVPSFPKFIFKDDQSVNYAQSIFAQIYETPFFYDYKGEITSRIIDKWYIEEDQKTYNFYLNDNITFHDGRKWTAHDWKEQLLSELSPLELQTVDTIEINGDYKLSIKFNTPNENYIRMLTKLSSAIIHRDDLKKDMPTGSGAFEIVDITDDKIVLKRTKGFYHDKYRPQCPIEKITFVKYLKGTINAEQFVGSDLDFVALTPFVGEAPDGYFVKQMPEMAIVVMFINSKDPTLRKAIWHCFDRKNFEKSKFGQIFNLRLYDSFFPSGIDGYIPKLIQQNCETAFRELESSGKTYESDLVNIYPEDVDLITDLNKSIRKLSKFLKINNKDFSANLKDSFSEYSNNENQLLIMAYGVFDNTTFKMSLAGDGGLFKNYSKELHDTFENVDVSDLNKRINDMVDLSYKEHLVLPLGQRMKSVAFPMKWKNIRMLSPLHHVWVFDQVEVEK